MPPTRLDRGQANPEARMPLLRTHSRHSSTDYPQRGAGRGALAANMGKVGKHVDFFRPPDGAFLLGARRGIHNIIWQTHLRAGYKRQPAQAGVERLARACSPLVSGLFADAFSCSPSAGIHRVSTRGKLRTSLSGNELGVGRFGGPVGLSLLRRRHLRGQMDWLRPMCRRIFGLAGSSVEFWKKMSGSSR